MVSLCLESELVLLIARCYTFRQQGATILKDRSLKREFQLSLVAASSHPSPRMNQRAYTYIIFVVAKLVWSPGSLLPKYGKVSYRKFLWVGDMQML